MPSQIFYSSAYATLAVADSTAAAASGVLIIDRAEPLGGNLTLATGQIIFMGGPITLGNYDLTFDNNALSGPCLPLFIFTGSGRVKGTFRSERPVVEWFGADPTSNQATGVPTRTRQAFQYFAEYAVQSLTPGMKIFCLGNYYFDTTGVVISGNPYVHPVFQGEWGSTNVTFLPTVSGTPAFSFEGGTGSISGGGLREFTIAGNYNMVALQIAGACGITSSISVQGQALVGVRYHNRDAEQFTEFCETHIQSSITCLTACEYKVTNGRDSFHGSGLVAFEGRPSVIAVNGNYQAILLTPGNNSTQAIPYDAPLDVSLFPYNGPTSIDVTIVTNNNTVAVQPSFIGKRMGIEAFNDGTVRLVNAGGPEILFAMDYEFWGNYAKFYKAPGRFIRSVRRRADGGNLIEFEPQENSLLYTGASQRIFNFPGNVILNWQVNVDIVAPNYHFQYLFRIYADDVGGVPVIVPGDAPFTVNTAGYGAPTFTVDNIGLMITNAGYPTSPATVSIGVEARQIGKTFARSEHP